ncbi:SpoIIE family protein phosphatase [Rhodopirellula sp.]|nr:SpoIIE family protein phosphatase [Rhodopirellula sp.]
MTKTIPNYLRIHRGIERQAPTTSEPPQNLITSFWNTYSEATGWRIDSRASRKNDMLELLPAVTSETTIGREDESTPVVGRIAATRLANAASKLTEQALRTQECLRQREAELASSAAMIGVEYDGKVSADQIEQSLADAMEACKCDAAALYMLDEDTRYLKTRSVVGLPNERLENPPRELRGSRGDLEAMVQDVVTIDNMTAGSIDTWNSPEPFAAGICVAIKVDDIPIGTLWLFRETITEFSGAESAVARLVATNLSLLLRQSSQADIFEGTQPNQSVQEIAQWQYESLPVGSALAEGWRVDGMLESPESWATGWHHWDVLPDGSIMLAIAEASDPTAKGAMHAAIARAALAAHSGYRHTPAQLIQRVSDTLWQTNTGEQLVSLIYAHLDPETGEGVVASAGTISALISSRYGYRPLVSNHSEPLNTSMDSNAANHDFNLLQGETLLAYSKGFSAAGADQMTLGGHIRTAMQLEDRSPLAMLRRKLTKLPLTRERGALTLLRI